MFLITMTERLQSSEALTSLSIAIILDTLFFKNLLINFEKKFLLLYKILQCKINGTSKKKLKKNNVGRSVISLK